MRAWHVLHALAACHDVHLIVAAGISFRATELREVHLPVVGRRALPRPHLRTARRLARRIARRGAPTLSRWLAPEPPEWAACGASSRTAIHRFVQGKQIEVQHVFRLYMMPVAETVRSCLPGIRTQVDLDDLEFDTRMRFAELHSRRGEHGAAEVARRDARFYEAAATKYLPAAEQVWVCSDLDRARLRERLGLDGVRVVPNTAPIPRVPLPPAGAEPFTFLFVGPLGYFPNRAGVEWFCEQVVPALRSLTRRPFRVRVVGKNPWTDRVRFADYGPDVDALGFVPDLTPHYADAGAVVVPIHAGGGTRIKVLEAFARRRPVISTPMGVEGLDVEDGVHVLMAADERTFAEQCRRVMEEPSVAAGLAERAWELFRARYSPDVVAASVRNIMTEAPERPGRPATSPRPSARW